MFKKISVKEVRNETKDAVSIALDIPEGLKKEFQYQSGQYITIKHVINGEDVRRAYSLSSSPNEDDFRIAVKKIEDGRMSSFLNEKLNNGDVLDIMPPSGNFLIKNLKSTVVGFAAGSGITPIISMLKTVLVSGGNFTLFYSNKDTNNVIFKEELNALQNTYPSNFKLHYIYSRENIGNPLLEGRLNKEKCTLLIKEELELLKADGFYMCGPEEMVLNISASLSEFGVNKDKIHFELFTTPTLQKESEKPVSDFSGTSSVKVIMDGEDFEFDLKNDGDYVLDAAMNAGADVPFSCKGAVCCTCKAQVLEGKATMDMNYSLSDEEVAEGFILTCQARPASKHLVIDYDVI